MSSGPVYPGGPKGTAPQQEVAQGDVPEQVVDKFTNKLAGNTGVTSTSAEPGVPGVPAGTAFPVADLANKKAKNAGATTQTASPQQQQSKEQPIPAKPVVVDQKPTEKASPQPSKQVSHEIIDEWKRVGGWTDDQHVASREETTDMIERAALLESYISDRYLGDWVENTHLIIGTALFAWLVARLGGGLGWLFIVLAFTAMSYRSKIRRLYRDAADDVTREGAMKRIETEVEKLEWLNSFLVKFWIIYEPVLSETIVGVANQVLAGATPGFIESLSLKEFTLGTKPPRIMQVRSYPLTDLDVVEMDWSFSFDPNETQDMTARQLKDKKNPKVELSVRIGKGVVSKGLPILVEDMSFSGEMHVRIKLIPTFPHVKTVDVSFLKKPDIGFVLKPIGGDTLGFDVNVIPGLESFIMDTVHANLGPMLYAPSSFQINVEEMMAAAAPDSAIGVLAITVFSGNGLKGTDAIGNTVDPYIIFALNGGNELARTDIKKDTKNPRWNETKYILVNNLTDILELGIYDFNDHRKDKIIGTATVKLDNLMEKPDQTGISLEVVENGKSRGTIDCELHWFPVLEGKTLEDGTTEPPPDTNTGIVKFITHQCKDLDAAKSLVGQLSPYSDLLMNGNLLHQSTSLKRTNNPVWDDTFEFLVTDKSKCNIGVRVKDSRGLATDPVIGTYNIHLDTLLSDLSTGKDWFNMTPSGRVRLEAIWKPIALKGAAASKNYIEPIGSIRIHIIKAAEELRNLETIGKVDPYVRLFLNGFQRGRTMAVPSTLAPTWDEVLYIPVQKAGQRLVLEAMDAENIGQDRSLGQFELNTGDFIKENPEGGYLEYVDPKARVTSFSTQKGKKGALEYTISFFPSTPVMNPDLAEELRKSKEEKANAAEDGEEVVSPEEGDEENTLDDIPLAELIKSESGIAALTFLDSEITDTDLFIRVLVDDIAYPSYSTPRITHRKQPLGETGELVIRELEWSQLTFQVTSKVNKPKKDEIFCNFKVNTLDLLKKSYDKPYSLQIKNGSKVIATTSVRMRYFPLHMQLDPSESINNMGVLTGEIVSAENVPAADRSGYSDPYAVILLNGEKVFKTKIVKKTLNPVWNESFSTEILSRTGSKFTLEVYDWDMGPGDDDFLGEVDIDLTQIEPLTPLALTLPLKGKSGTITANLLFKPSYVRREIDAAGIGATFANGAAMPGKVIGGAIGGATGAVTGAAGLATGAVGGAAGLAAGGIGAVGGAVGGVGGFVGNGVKGGANRLKTPFGKRKSDDDAAVGGDASDSASHAGSGDRQSLSGSFNISYATGFEDSPSLQVKAFLAGKKEKEVHKTKAAKPTDGQFTFDDSFSFSGSADTQYIFRVYLHKSLGRHEELGEVVVTLGEQSPGEPFTLPVKELGELTLLMDA